MDGPAHYAEAEAALVAIQEQDGALTDAEIANVFAAAQVHATLALAAATIDRLNGAGSAWQEAVR